MGVAERLTGHFVSDTFLRLVQYIDGEYYDGAGNLLTIGGVCTDISTSHVFYDSALDLATTMAEDVGGISAGTTVADLYGDSMTSILDSLLFPTANPTLTPPSATFVINPTTTVYEFAANPEVTFTTTFSRGSISPQYDATSPYRSGLPNGYYFTGPELVDASSTSLTNVQTIDVSIIASQSFSADVWHDAGVQPYDNKGNPYDSPLPAGIIDASPTVTFYGAYPIFATTSDIDTLTKQTLVRMSTTTYAPTSAGVTLVAETGGSKQKFEIPVAWPYTDLTGVQTYNTVSGEWEYQGGGAAASLTYWDVTDETETIQGLTIDYKRYTYNGTDRSEITIRIVI